MSETIQKWDNCYDKQLKGFIVPEAFTHPAKFSLGLIERIYDYCLERGYLHKSDFVGDAFGGVAIGGLVAAYRGLHWRGVELEPKFVALAEQNIALHKSKLLALTKPLPVIIQGDSRHFSEHVAAVVSSPPYSDSINGGEGPGARYDFKTHLPDNAIKQTCDSDYGQTPGQIGRLKAGEVSGVISSPPFASQQSGGGIVHQSDRKTIGRKNCGYQNQGNSSGQIADLKEGKISTVISSPPYAVISAGAGGLNTKPAKHKGQQSGRKASSASQDTDQRYGETEGQISQLKGGSVEAVVSSPPWEQNCEGNKRASKFNGYVPDNGKGHYGSPEARKRAAEKSNLMEYGDSPGQIGKEKGETYWQAMDAVYRSCFIAIKPGGYIALVVKDYIKGGKRVPLCDDTCRLLEHIGFTMVERIHAMLVKETHHGDLFNGHTVQTKSRKSFFRRLAEKNGSPKIDFEEVLIAQKL